jgi:hypothetical protein
MRSAIDMATGDIVSAAHVVQRRAYQCPSCGRRVVFRGGQVNAKHFAHAKYVADENCELYFSPGVPYTGRRYRAASVQQRAYERLQLEQIAFGVGSSGPLLTVCLPPCAPEPWNGALHFEHPSQIPVHRRAQTIRFSHLERGCRVSFPLVEGQWSIAPTGDVSKEYLSRISVGSQSLESFQNLFDATRDFGKQILPSMPITAGDELWWVARQQISVPSVVAHLVTLALECEAYGWFVHKVTLARELPYGHERDAVAQWLQRPIRPRRALVWVEQPWAFTYRPTGVPVYRLEIGVAWTIRSDQVVDIAICPAKGGEPVLMAESTLEAKWNDPQPGSWELSVNERAYDLFEVVETVEPVPRNLRFKVNGRDAESARDAQTMLDASLERKVCTVEIAWQAEGVSRLVHPSGSVHVVFHDHSAQLELKRGSTVDLENLGVLVRPMFEKVECVTSDALAVLRARARWLLSVSATGSRTERLVISPRWRSDPLIRRLVGTAWDMKLAPQVRAFQRLLGVAR